MVKRSLSDIIKGTDRAIATIMRMAGSDKGNGKGGKGEQWQ